jgi:hypothetical protein
MLAQSLLDCHKSSCQAGKPLALKVFICGRNRQENDGATALAQAFKVSTSQIFNSLSLNHLYEINSQDFKLFYLSLCPLSLGFWGVKCYLWLYVHPSACPSFGFFQ